VPHKPLENSPPDRLKALLFIACWLAYAYFHQGGGWNQNARFAMVRAMAEQHTFAIDDYLIYTAADSHGDSLARVPIRAGRFLLAGHRHTLVWSDRQGRIEPLQDGPVVAGSATHIDSIAASGDIAYASGHIHPNKAPGTSFAALPAYWLLYQLTRLGGGDPDNHRNLGINAWLTNAFSNALISALGVLIFYNLVLLLWNVPRHIALASAATFALATMWFPYATMLYEQNLSASGLLAAFYLLVKTGGSARAEKVRLFLAGLAAGGAVLASYVSVFAVACLGVYLLWRRRQWRPALLFALGGLLPFLLLCGYNQACFGNFLTTNYAFQNPVFKSAGNVLGVFDMPRPDRLLMLLFSPYRGLFFTAPVLLAASAGLVGLWRGQRPECLLILAIVAFFLLFNISFEGWHGGWSVAPRYLGPLVPFLALGLPPALARFPIPTGLAALVSAAIFLLITAVDPQSPLGSSAAFSLPQKNWRHNHLTAYLWPLFRAGLATPVIDAQIDRALDQAALKLPAELDAFSRRQALSRLREESSARARRPDANFPPSLVTGPVSANPMGLYEGW